PDAVARAVVDAWRALAPAGEPVAVRSSGVKEDLEGASFAGQYETFINVRGEDALLDAVKRCWASIWRNRVLQYASKKGGGATDLAMSVVVQRMVEADVSGVLFTVNPVTGREREALVEAVFGLGEALVSGRTNADRYVVDVATGEALSREIAEKKMKCVPLPPGESEKGPTGGRVFTREVPLAGEEARRATLDAARLAALVEIGARVQEHYGRPIDVEWVLVKEALHLVQARPITKLSFAADFGEWTTADFKDGGVSSDVCSPMMWSLYESVLEHSMPRYFKDIKLLDEKHQANWGRMFFARPYWNLGEVKRVLEKIPGYVERNFDEDLGVAVTYEGPGRTTPTTLGGLASALPVLFALKRNYKERIEADKRFHAAFPERCREYDLEPEDLAKLDRPGFAKKLRALVTGLYFETETSYFYTIYNTSNSKLDFKVHFEKAARACEKRGERLDYLALVSGLEDLSHMRPMKDLFDVCNQIHTSGRTGPTDEEVSAFAHRWRHKGRKELDIRVPRWKGDLAYVREMIEQAAASHDARNDPVAHARAQHATYEAARDMAARAFGWAHPLARRAFQDGLALVRTYAWWREEMRDRSSFAYHLVRLWCVEAARRLHLEGTFADLDDVWYLPFQDLLALVEGDLAPPAA
ncbi:MAG: PEP/pyruvate-binding domain-containing protein, partial [Polyangiaceae bacterium]